MAEAVPFGIATTILSKLGSSAFRELSLVYGVENDMRKLENTMSTVKAALLDADQRQENSHLVRDWIKKLNYVVYDADDVIDAFSTKGLQLELNSTDGRVLNMQQVCEFFSSSNSFDFRYKMGQKIKEVRERLDEIATDMRNLNFMLERVIVGGRINYEGRETHSFVLMSEVIGRDKEKEEIIQLLMCSSNQKANVSVIPIVGIGGLGKTTLAQLVYSDERVVEYFELRIWVCVSEDFEIKSLVMKILKSITINVVTGDLDLEQLQSQLRQKLDGKRYLLMLDDVWNETYEKWVGVRNLLMGGAKESSIVVTTRSRKVASVMGVEHPYVLEGLSKEESWSLFEKVAFGGHEKVNTKLMVIGKDIVMRCKRVPLAIRSLASVLQSKTEESEWLFIQNSNIWQGDDILPILKLSYDHLPTYLKQCFAYCAIFPKDHEIKKELLIQLWIAQGYVQSPDASQHLEEIGNHYFRDLLSRSFFQEARVDDDNNEVLISCKMHDLIHDLAMRVAGFDCRIVESDTHNISERIRHVWISRDVTKVSAQLMKAKGLRTLFGSASRDYICKAVLSKLRCLRVLNASCYFHNNKVPKSICKLQHLRYLDFSQNDMRSLSNSIRKLVNLQTLKLSDCRSLKRLPEGITKLINLRYLEIDGCSDLKYMPRGMGKLTSLRRLNKFVVGGNKWGLRLSELNGLNEIRGDIFIEGLKKVKDVRWESKEANLMAKQYVHSLRLKWKWGYKRRGGIILDEILLEGLQPHPILKELSVEGYSGEMFPSWMTTAIPNIVRITLERCDRCKQLPQSLDQLPFLKFLTLKFLEGLEHINNDDNRVEERKSSSTSTAAEGMSVFFPSLEELVIQDLPQLKGWWRAAERETSSMMMTGEVAEERASVSSQRPSSFPRLTKLEIKRCPKLTSMTMTGEEEEEEKREESSQRPSFPRLTKLVIQHCEQLTSMPIHSSHHLEELEVGRVPEKLVRQLLLVTTSAATTTTTEAITAASSSSSTSSSSSSSSSIPTAIISSKLKSLSIWGIQDLEYLPVDAFRNLVSLETLEIEHCPRLSSCFSLGSEKEEEEEEEEGFLRVLPSLRSLAIGWCDSLTSLSAGVTLHLTALQDLHIRYCKNLLNLTTGEIPKLASLRGLHIVDCPSLMGLPDWLSNLTSLQYLDISGCPLLSERCQKETGEDWSNISHIPTIFIDGKPFSIKWRG